MSYADNYEQAFRIMQNIRRAQRRGEVFGVSGVVNAWAQAQRRRDETMKDKMTEEQAKLYAALLWEELCKPEYYTGEFKKMGSDGVKEHAKAALTARGVVPDQHWLCTCPFCHLYHNLDHQCIPCPFQRFVAQHTTVACQKAGPYLNWRGARSVETARAMADFCWSVYRGQDGSDKERKACACCKGEEAKAVRFAEGDRVKMVGFTFSLDEWPVWGEKGTHIGGTVYNTSPTRFNIRFDNGALNPGFVQGDPRIVLLTSAERLMLTQRPIQPGDVFKYWNDEELRTLVAVSDGDDDDEVRFHFLDVTDVDSPFIVTEGFDPDEEREVDDVACYRCSHLGYNVEFERLVPVGRMKWSVEPKA